VIGIEISPHSVSLEDLPFMASIAFMPGNEGTGLSKQQQGMCDGYVYIPQYGSATASLNVHIASTVVLHKYNLQLNKSFESTYK